MKNIYNNNDIHKTFYTDFPKGHVICNNETGTIVFVKNSAY